VPSLFIILLFLHVAAAILAFGPSYTTPMVMKMVAEEPEHRSFVSRMNPSTLPGRNLAGNR
jgi:hypothetical protein